MIIYLLNLFVQVESVWFSIWSSAVIYIIKSIIRLELNPYLLNCAGVRYCAHCSLHNCNIYLLNLFVQVESVWFSIWSSAVIYIIKSIIRLELNPYLLNCAGVRYCAHCSLHNCNIYLLNLFVQVESVWFSIWSSAVIYIIKTDHKIRIKSLSAQLCRYEVLCTLQSAQL